jgi:hypothetical protein
MREPPSFTREEYALTKVALARQDVPAEALDLLSAWIEGERLLVDDREGVGGIDFCRMKSLLFSRQVDNTNSHNTRVLLHNALEKAVSWNLVSRNVCDVATLPKGEKYKPQMLTIHIQMSTCSVQR